MFRGVKINIRLFVVKKLRNVIGNGDFLRFFFYLMKLFWVWLYIIMDIINFIKFYNLL